MKLAKAIEILKHTPIQVVCGDDLKYGEARKLGIEAMKRWQQRHDQCPDDVNFLLPGETKD